MKVFVKGLLVILITITGLYASSDSYYDEFKGNYAIIKVEGSHRASPHGLSSSDYNYSLIGIDKESKFSIFVDYIDYLIASDFNEELSVYYLQTDKDICLVINEKLTTEEISRDRYIDIVPRSLGCSRTIWIGKDTLENNLVWRKTKTLKNK
ncbi:MAG: hypothetical protein U9Q15_02875 [Patescibacteria group bacterium]|nr:hypothetical protein [Patescibacteria group bacterium]